ncbi:MAG TPA: Lsr2 family protein [Pseudonocardiaceae bacterium]
MAKKTVIQLCDDLDGIADESVQTIDFSLDGVQYEIDLNPDNADALRTGLTEYIDRARRAGGPPRPDQPPRPSAHDRELSRKIRRWAMDNNWEISHRGRLPLDIVDAYRRAMPRRQRR